MIYIVEIGKDIHILVKKKHTMSGSKKMSFVGENYKDISEKMKEMERLVHSDDSTIYILDDKGKFTEYLKQRHGYTIISSKDLCGKTLTPFEVAMLRRGNGITYRLPRYSETISYAYLVENGYFETLVLRNRIYGMIDALERVMHYSGNTTLDELRENYISILRSILKGVK